jgi:hypothetical protein
MALCYWLSLTLQGWETLIRLLQKILLLSNRYDFRDFYLFVLELEKKTTKKIFY